MGVIPNIKNYFKVFIFSLFIFSFIGCSDDEMPIEPQQPMPNTDTVVFVQGDVFSKTFEQTEISQNEVFALLKELKKFVNINKCKPDDFYEITYTLDKTTWTNFKYFPSGKYFYELTKSTDNVITGHKKHLATVKQIYEAGGTIDSSLWQSMSDANIIAEVILKYADIFSWQIDFLTDTRQGDRFKLVFEVESLEKKNTTVSTNILAAQYFSGTSSWNAFYFNNGKDVDGYFDENGKSMRNMFLKAPLQFKRISSFFTKKRYHPILKYYRAHEGIDYAAPKGTPVSAIADGVVKKSQYSGGYGNLVVLKHSNGYESYYGHLSKYGRGIKKGVRVKQGQVIGYVGSTGLSTGPHLDFRIKKNKTFVNFLKIKMPPVTTLQGPNKESFDVIKTELTTKLDSIE